MQKQGHLQRCAELWLWLWQAHEELQGQLDSLEPQLLTDLVWSLCVLQQAKPPYLQRVLAPDFHAVIQGKVGSGARAQVVGVLGLVHLHLGQHRLCAQLLGREGLVSPAVWLWG